MNYAFYFSVSAIHISQWFRCCTFASDESGRAQNLHEISIDLLLNSNKLSRSRFSAALNAQILNANGEKKKNDLTTGKRSRSKRMLARSFVRFETCLSTSKLNDYTKAWHKLNFHMNCNLSIVVIERNSQYLFLASFSLPLPPSLSSLACFTFVFIHILMHFLSVRYSSMNSQIANSTNKSTQHGCTQR